MKRSLIAGLLQLCLSADGDAASGIETLNADVKFSTDATCSQLKPGVGAKDLGSFQSDVLKRVATALVEGRYDRTSRAAGTSRSPSRSSGSKRTPAARASS